MSCIEVLLGLPDEAEEGDSKEDDYVALNPKEDKSEEVNSEQQSSADFLFENGHNSKIPKLMKIGSKIS